MRPSVRARKDADNRFTGPVPDDWAGHVRALRTAETDQIEARRVAGLPLAQVEDEMAAWRGTLRFSMEAARLEYEKARRISGDQWQGRFGHRVRHLLGGVASAGRRLARLAARREDLLDRLPVGCRTQAEIGRLVRRALDTTDREANATGRKVNTAHRKIVA